MGFNGPSAAPFAACPRRLRMYGVMLSALPDPEPELDLRPERGDSRRKT